MVAIDDGLRQDAFFFGGERNGRPMAIRARYHQHVLAALAAVAGENIGWQVCPGDMPDVERSICIRPCDRYQNVLCHISSISAYTKKHRGYVLYPR